MEYRPSPSFSQLQLQIPFGVGANCLSCYKVFYLIYMYFIPTKEKNIIYVLVKA